MPPQANPRRRRKLGAVRLQSSVEGACEPISENAVEEDVVTHLQEAGSSQPGKPLSKIGT